MNTDSKKTETEQCTIPSVVCSCGGGNGAYPPIGLVIYLTLVVDC